MRNAGMSWVENVSSLKKAAVVFDEQLKSMIAATSSVGLNLHVWPDKQVARYSQLNVEHWFYKPTVESW